VCVHREASRTFMAKYFRDVWFTTSSTDEKPPTPSPSTTLYLSRVSRGTRSEHSACCCFRMVSGERLPVFLQEKSTIIVESARQHPVTLAVA